MTRDEFREVLGSVSFGYPFKAWKMRVYMSVGYFYHSDDFRFRLECWVPHRDTGRSDLPLESSYSWPPYAAQHLTREEVIAAVYSKAKELVLHELDEAWHVDGYRCADPHSPNPKVVPPKREPPPPPPKFYDHDEYNLFRFSNYTGSAFESLTVTEVDPVEKTVTYSSAPATPKKQNRAFLDSLNKKFDRRSRR